MSAERRPYWRPAVRLVPPRVTCPACGFSARPYQTRARALRRGSGPLVLCWWCLPPTEEELLSPDYWRSIRVSWSYPVRSVQVAQEAAERQRMFGA